MAIFAYGIRVAIGLPVGNDASMVEFKVGFFWSEGFLIFNHFRVIFWRKLRFLELARFGEKGAVFGFWAKDFL